MGKLVVEIDKRQVEKYRKQGLWGDATLLDYWLLSVKSYADKTMVVDDQDSSYTYRELDRASDCLAVYLKEECNLEEGDIVSVQLPNWAEFTLILIACLKIGVVVNPLLTGFRESELIHRLSKCSAKVMFVPGEFRNCNHVVLAEKVAESVPSLQKIVIVDKHSPYNGQGKDGTIFQIFWRTEVWLRNTVRAKQRMWQLYYLHQVRRVLERVSC